MREIVMDKIDKAVERMAAVADADNEDKDFWDAVDAYQKKFDDLPTIMGLMDKQREMTKVLREAVKSGKPIPDDDEWYKALGLDPLPPDVLV
jgi:hypothetical protein